MGKRILAIGEVLWDLLPSGRQLGQGACQLCLSLPRPRHRGSARDAHRR